MICVNFHFFVSLSQNKSIFLSKHQKEIHVQRLWEGVLYKRQFEEASTYPHDGGKGGGDVVLDL